MNTDTFTMTSALSDAVASGRGTVFFLARGGLRRLSGSGRGFLGYTPEDIFWRDMLKMMHEDDLPAVEISLWRVKNTPGTCEWVEARMMDVWGVWRPVELTVNNLVETPGDGGLVVVEALALEPDERRASGSRESARR